MCFTPNVSVFDKQVLTRCDAYRRKDSLSTFPELYAIVSSSSTSYYGKINDLINVFIIIYVRNDASRFYTQLLRMIYGDVSSGWDWL